MKLLHRKDGIPKSRFILTASKMPGLSHYPDRSKPFRHQESDVVKWLLSQDDTWRWMFEKARTLGVIVFDPVTKLWHGVDTEDGRRILEEREMEKEKNDVPHGTGTPPTASQPHQLGAGDV